MIDIQQALSHPKGVYEYVNSLRKTLKPLTIEDESIRSGMGIYERIDSPGRQFDYVSFERALLVVDYVEDYQVMRGFLWNYGDYENMTLVETMQSWIYMGKSGEDNPNELDFKFVAPQVKNKKGEWVCTNEKDMLPFFGDVIPDSFGNGICPIGRLHPLLVRNGLTMEGLVQVCSYIGKCYKLMRLLIVNPIIEKIIKAQQYSFCRLYLDQDSFSKYLPQVKICSRHHYIIENALLWCDYIEMLEGLREDIQNPKNICPENLEQAHDRLLQRLESKKMKQNADVMRLYENWASQYEHIAVEDEKYIIRPIVSVQEMKEEGQEMRHCVYTAQYYKKVGQSIILSCRDKTTNERVATIECNTQSMNGDDSILQIRGPHNSEPKDYYEICLLAHQWFDQTMGRTNGQVDSYVSGESGGFFLN